jgi:hypothetical protein
MTVMHEVEFQFAVGEEVVVRLDQAEVRGDAADLPAWSIGEIVERFVRGGRPSYALTMRIGDAVLTCVVAEQAIEGTA